MNKRLFIKTCIYSISILCVISILILSSINEESIPDNTKTQKDIYKNTSNTTDVPENASLSHYLIILENNKVNIYEVYSGNKKIHKGTLNISPDTLREIDRIKFENGIILETADDILHIAEDFSS